MDTITEPATEPKSAKKKRRKQPAKRAAPRDGGKSSVDRTMAVDELGGLTASECPFDCNSERCVISGMSVCAHPRKGGLQPAVQRDPEAMTRYNAARKKLAHQAVDVRA